MHPDTTTTTISNSRKKQARKTRIELETLLLLLLYYFSAAKFTLHPQTIVPNVTKQNSFFVTTSNYEMNKKKVRNDNLYYRSKLDFVFSDLFSAINRQIEQ